LGVRSVLIYSPNRLLTNAPLRLPNIVTAWRLWSALSARAWLFARRFRNLSKRCILQSSKPSLYIFYLLTCFEYSSNYRIHFDFAMDVLSAASSVIAVASLALQLGDMTRKLCNFWKAVKGAPREIEQIVSDLSIIASLADIIRQEAESPRPHTQLIDINLEALGQCLSSMTDLQNVILKYQSGISSSSRRAQTWSACKMSWNGEKIGSFRKSVQDAKFTLILARQESLK
jgi:hypothetical protein